MNAIGIDCAVAGNHDFDWSAPHFLNLAKDSNYVRNRNLPPQPINVAQ
jgi:2',3'-cyclic-nucleotide 2'-phosphodiesterase (5'-nucleotidase family)